MLSIRPSLRATAPVYRYLSTKHIKLKEELKMPSRNKKVGASLIALLIIATLILAACGPAPAPETVIQTVVVEKEVEKIVTQEVEKIVEKVVTEVIEKEVTIVETVEVEAEAPAGARGSCGTVTLLYWQAVSMVNAYLSGGTKDIHAGFGRPGIAGPLRRVRPIGALAGRRDPHRGQRRRLRRPDEHHLEAQAGHPLVRRHAIHRGGRGLFWPNTAWTRRWAATRSPTFPTSRALRP